MTVLLRKHNTLLPTLFYRLLLNVAVINLGLNYLTACPINKLEVPSTLVFTKGLHSSGQDGGGFATADELLEGAFIEMICFNIREKDELLLSRRLNCAEVDLASQDFFASILKLPLLLFELCTFLPVLDIEVSEACNRQSTNSDECPLSVFHHKLKDLIL